jgi:hypothetical protein
MGMAQERAAKWSEAKLSARGMKAGAKILRAAGDKPAGMAPHELLVGAHAPGRL